MLNGISDILGKGERERAYIFPNQDVVFGIDFIYNII